MQDNFVIQINFEMQENFKVNIFYKSKQILRFHLTCKDKELKLEKRLLIKTQPWKILFTNFAIDNSPMYLYYLVQALERGIKPPREPYVHPKNR